MQLLKTTNTDTRFVALCSELDADLSKQNGQQLQSVYSQYNTLEKIQNVVLALQDETPVACAALKEYAPGTAEVKRVFTKPYCRGQGVAAAVIAALEQLAKQQGYTRLVLETGLTMGCAKVAVRMPAAANTCPNRAVSAASLTVSGNSSI